MASSSLSQESLDHELNLMARKNRVKIAARNRAIYTKHGSIETTDDHDMGETKMEELMAGEHVLCVSPGSLLFDHESPNRMTKMKEKRWPAHKSKPMIKDKRKLREKRRSSGVVHVQTTESSDNSNDESDSVTSSANSTTQPTTITSSSCSQSTQQHATPPSSLATNSQSIILSSLASNNTLVPATKTHYNEVIDADNPQTPEEDRKPFNNRAVRNKSPSDLDADLEDNQDYDSTVSQSDNTSTRALPCLSNRQQSANDTVSSGLQGSVGGILSGSRGTDAKGSEGRVTGKRVGFENFSKPAASSCISSPPMPKAYGNAIRQQHHHYHHHHYNHNSTNNKYNKNSNVDFYETTNATSYPQRSNYNAEELLRIEKCRVQELEMLVHKQDDLIKNLKLQVLSLSNRKLPGSLTGV